MYFEIGGIILESANDNTITWNTILYNPECINQTGCTGNLIANNDCGNGGSNGNGGEIPGFELSFLLIELIILLLVVSYYKRAEFKLIR